MRQILKGDIPGPDDRAFGVAKDAVEDWPHLIGVTHLIALVGGRTLYQKAQRAANGKVLLERKEGGKITKRYIPFDAAITLVPVATARQWQEEGYAR